jgi:2-C-methyl-D-erythritol 4-phosphate cytidylyltransferase
VTASDKQHIPDYWAVIPAAGVGKRMQSPIPKQYLPLAEKTVIEHTLSHFISNPNIKGIVIALSADDGYWPALNIDCDKPLLIAEGGQERCHSVLNALQLLAEQAHDNDWVLVHDAARPCLSQDDIAALINALSAHDTGGLLGVPVRDTLKRTDTADQVESTVDRNNLWHALTPQMFSLAALRTALQSALDKKQLVTDEASAMELAGQSPLMVEGSANNLKITRPEDLILAEFYIRRGMVENLTQPELEGIDGLNADDG